MPRVELTARLARESKAGEKDTILFDKGLPGFVSRVSDRAQLLIALIRTAIMSAE